MNGSFGVLRRRVNGGKHQGAVPSTQNIMPCAARHEHSISRAEVVANVQVFPARPHADKSLSAFHADELIRVRVHFHADVAAGRDAHQGHLQMMSCPKCAAEIVVMPRCARNIHNKWIAPVIGPTAVLHWMMRVHIIRSFQFRYNTLCSFTCSGEWYGKGAQRKLIVDPASDALGNPYR